MNRIERAIQWQASALVGERGQRIWLLALAIEVFAMAAIIALATVLL